MKKIFIKISAMGIAFTVILLLVGSVFYPISQVSAQNGTTSPEQSAALQSSENKNAANQGPVKRFLSNLGQGRWGGNVRSPQNAPVPKISPAPIISTEENEKSSPVLIATAPIQKKMDPVKKSEEKGTGPSSPISGESASGKNDLHKNAFPGSFAQWDNAFHYSWIEEEKERHQIKPHADNKALVKIKGSQKEGHTYGNYTESDILLWEQETERLVVEGSLIFHNADLLGSTNATSCDMCHPDAEGTHAETYPKYQVQLGRVALLRDMANWCLQNPCRAEPMSGDDPRMRALEAYMQAQRSGKIMKYGKH